MRGNTVPLSQERSDKIWWHRLSCSARTGEFEVDAVEGTPAQHRPRPDLRGVAVDETVSLVVVLFRSAPFPGHSRSARFPDNGGS